MHSVLGVSLWGNGKLLKSADDNVWTTVYAPNLLNRSLKKGSFYGMQITCNKTVNNNMEKNPSLTCQDALPSEN